MTILFNKRLAELDAYLQMLIDKNEQLDKKINSTTCGDQRKGLEDIKTNLDGLLGTIKHSIVLLQIAKVSLEPNSEGTSRNEHDRPLRLRQSSTPNRSNSVSSFKTTAAITASLLQEQQKFPPKPPVRASKRFAGTKEQKQLHGEQTSPSSASFAASPRLNANDLCKLQTSANSSTPASSPMPRSSSTPVTVSLAKIGPSAQAVDSQSEIEISRSNSQSRQPRECDKSPSANETNNRNLSPVIEPREEEGDLKSRVSSLSDKDSDTEEDEEEAFYDAADEQQGSIDVKSSSSKLISKSLDSQEIKNIEPHSARENNNTMTQSELFGAGAEIDWDALYDEEEEDLGSLESHGSVIKHLISQIRIGMDLTKVVLPTFILERRSLLEMYADFFAHPDLFSSIPEFNSSEERMVQLVKWYLSAFHAGRKSSVAKKPYNPILGEIFECYWYWGASDKEQVDRRKNESNRINEENLQCNNHASPQDPINGATEWLLNSPPKGSLLFVAEQVSHHPPISAFYASNLDKSISCCAHIYTKSKYLGLSVGVHHIGHAIVEDAKNKETYVCTFPSAYGRSILTVPWVELGGSIDIVCQESGYSAKIEFITKPFYGGKKHRVVGEILQPNKEAFISVEGEWNGCIHSKDLRKSGATKEVFVDTKSMAVMKKQVRPVSCQKSFESRNVWKEVTRALKLRDVDGATAAKCFIEQRQRDNLKARTEEGVGWETRYFRKKDDEEWIYSGPLSHV